MFALTISYDISRPARSLGAYRVNLTDIGDDGTPEPLRQHGHVEGNIVRYSGRYPSLAAALDSDREDMDEDDARVAQSIVMKVLQPATAWERNRNDR